LAAVVEHFKFVATPPTKTVKVLEGLEEFSAQMKRLSSVALEKNVAAIVLSALDEPSSPTLRKQGSAEQLAPTD
jgi:hypothetical protein